MKNQFSPKMLLLRATVFAVLISPASAVLPTAQAATPQNTPNTGGQALEIAPPVINLTADPGQTIKTEISLRDVSSSKLVVRGTVNDFTAAGEDGTPKIMLEEQENVDNPYSLKPWVAPLSTLTLEPRQIKKLPVTIRVPKDAAPGGYYGVIRFTANPPELEDTGVALSASLGSLVLLRVNGDIKEELAIEEFFATSATGNTSGQWLFETAPIIFVNRIKNTGSVHEQPSGLVTIKDMFGNTLATLGINQPPRNVLPGTIRRFEQSLDSTAIGNKILFGKYTAELSVQYNQSSPKVTKTIDFWVIPYRIIAVGLALLVAVFFALRFGIKAYNRTIIKQAQKKK